jgi:hypothetical protein
VLMAKNRREARLPQETRILQTNAVDGGLFRVW